MSISTTQAIRAQINRAIAEEQNNFRMTGYVQAVYQRNGVRLDDSQLQDAFQYLFHYICYVPELLDAFEAGAHKQGKSAEIQPFVRQVGWYFSSEQDYLPDGHGLYGLLDDAFYACKMIELYEAALRRKTGRVLVGDYDLPNRNNYVAGIIGHEVAGRITSDVQREVSKTESDNTMETLGALLLGGLVVGALFNQYAGNYGGGASNSSSTGWYEDDMASGMAEIQASINRRR